MKIWFSVQVQCVRILKKRKIVTVGYKWDAEKIVKSNTYLLAHRKMEQSLLWRRIVIEEIRTFSFAIFISSHLCGLHYLILINHKLKLAGIKNEVKLTIRKKHTCVFNKQANLIGLNLTKEKLIIDVSINSYQSTQIVHKICITFWHNTNRKAKANTITQLYIVKIDNSHYFSARLTHCVHVVVFFYSGNKV